MLNLWEIRAAVLSSFAAHLVLVTLAGARRRKASGVRMLLLWLAYLMADNVAVYALGHMSLDNRPHEDGLVAFWAPFLAVERKGPSRLMPHSSAPGLLASRWAAAT